MAIPYNPSSFNSNKTILQAIEELKKYLQENPCYKIYMYNDDYVDGTYVYVKSGVDDPDSIEAYDVIFFKNSYYSKVESVGDSTITVWPAINFTGAEGPQGPAGADGTDGTNGADGVSITNVAIDGSNHLICTLSDGNTIDAGELPSPDLPYITLLGTSGTLTADQYTTLISSSSAFIISAYYNALFRYSKNDILQNYISYTTINKTSSGINIVEIKISTDGTRAWTSSSIPVDPVEGTSVKSTGETSGKVLTADGTGGASWQTAGGGGSVYEHHITLTKSSGDPQFNITCIVVSDSSTLYNVNTFVSMLNTNSYATNVNTYTAVGNVSVGGNMYMILGLYRASGGDLGITYFTGTARSNTSLGTNLVAFLDKVLTL